MPTIEVAKTDTLEIQRQKINGLSAAFDNLQPAVIQPLAFQTLREDFVYRDTFASDLLTANPVISLYFDGEQAAGGIEEIGDLGMSNGRLTISHSIVENPLTGNKTFAAHATGMVYPVVAGDTHRFSCRIQLQKASENPGGDIFLGFSTYPSLSWNTAGRTGFIVSIPSSDATDIPYGDVEVRAWATNSQFPTPATILDQTLTSVSSMAVKELGSNAEFTNFEIEIGVGYAKFYINSVLVHTFENAYFGSDLTFHKPIVYIYSYASTFVAGGNLTYAIDFIGVDSKVTR